MCTATKTTLISSSSRSSRYIQCANQAKPFKATGQIGSLLKPQNKNVPGSSWFFMVD
jgi:hypothetical protein